MRGDKSYSYDLKEEVYNELLKKHNLEDYTQIINVGEGNSDTTVDSTIEAVKSILCSSNPPTAFFACNDLWHLEL